VRHQPTPSRGRETRKPHAIEHNLGDARLACTLGDALADIGSSIPGRASLALDVLVERRSGSERAAASSSITWA